MVCVSGGSMRIELVANATLFHVLSMSMYRSGGARRRVA